MRKFICIKSLRVIFPAPWGVPKNKIHTIYNPLVDIKHDEPLSYTELGLSELAIPIPRPLAAGLFIFFFALKTQNSSILESASKLVSGKLVPFWR
jgi:hypothetical protein